MPDLADFDEHPQDVPPPQPIIEYEVTYKERKGATRTIKDVRGFQFEAACGIYFLYIPVPGMPVPEVQAIRIATDDIRDFKIRPVKVIEHG